MKSVVTVPLNGYLECGTNPQLQDRQCYKNIKFLECSANPQLQDRECQKNKVLANHRNIVAEISCHQEYAVRCANISFHQEYRGVQKYPFTKDILQGVQIYPFTKDILQGIQKYPFTKDILTTRCAEIIIHKESKSFIPWYMQSLLNCLAKIS